MINNDFQREIWVQNHKAPNERSIKDTWKRIATANASIEKDFDKWYNEFYNLLYNFNFVPGGRIIANIGIDNRLATTLFNCYVHNPGDINYKDPDSIEGIFEMVKRQALTLKSEGGYGMNFSWLRPAGTYIDGIGARTPGVLKFMELWDKSSEIITMGTTKQFGSKRKNEKLKIRKGAQMGVLNCFSINTEILTGDGWLPIMDIIDRVSKGDIIFALDKYNNLHKIHSPIIKDIEQLYEIEAENGAVVQITADHKFEIYNTETNEIKLIPIYDIDADVDKLITIHNNKIEYSNIKKISMVSTGKSYDFAVSDSHRIIARKKNTKIGIYTSNCWHPDIEEFIVAKQTPGRLTKFNLSVGITDGFMEAVKNNDSWELKFPDTEFSKYKTEWTGNIQEWEAKNYPVNVYKSIKARKLWDTIMLSTYNRNEPGVLFLDLANKLNAMSYNEWLEASNPCVTGDTLISTDKGDIPIKTIIEDGINKYKVLTFNILDSRLEVSDIEWGNKTRTNADVIKLVLDDGTTLKLTPDHKVWTENNLYVPAAELTKNDTLVVNQGIIQYRKIISIYEVENEDVYDITVPKNHNFFANSICVHNCGEIIMPTGCCNLGSINLVKFIINPKDENVSPKFDYDLYKSQIQRAVRFLDNINDISTTPLPEYAEALKSKRRIGLGIMGLGSVHFMLGIRYGSPESIEFVNKLFKIKCETELLESAKLGKEKGSFLTFNKDKYFNTYWWKNLKISESIKREIEEIGCMRNSHRAANAPNGNTSLLAGIVSGGIEPVYMKSYTRWSVVNDYEKRKLINANVEFPNTQSGEWFETKDFKFSKRGDEEILKGEIENVKYEIDKNRGLTKATDVIDYGYNWLLNNYSTDYINTLEENGILATTTSLTADEHINVLKAITPWVDLNSSKTVNLPNDYPYDDFKKIYMNGWENNIKGLTTYRTGTMTAVLEEKKDIKDYQTELEEMFISANGHVIKENVKIPTEYYSKGYVVKDRNKKKWYFNIAFADKSYKKPFAIFITTNGRATGEVAEGVIVAMEQLLIKNKISLDLIRKQQNKYSGENNVNKVARAISMALRHNISLIDIVDVLSECHDGFATVLFATKKILSKFIQDGTKVKGEKCPSCNKATVIYQEGCRTCSNCGWSACS